MKIRQLTAQDDAARLWKAKIDRGLCAVSVEPGEMPQLAPWFGYMIGKFDRKRIYPEGTPTGARRGYKKAARALLLKAQRDHVWPSAEEVRERRAEANQRAEAERERQDRVVANSEAIERQRAEAPMVRRFDANAPHPLTYTHPSGAVAWLRRTTFGGREGFRMMVATALGRAAVGEGPTMIEDLSDAANKLDAIVGARFGDNWTAA